MKLASARLRLLAALIIGFGVLYASFELGRSLAGYSAVSAFSQRQALSRRVAALTRERDALEAKVAAGAVTRRVEEEAQAEAQAMIGELQAGLARQQQELDFYRGLLSDRFGTGTIKVQDLSIRGQGEGRYTLGVTLVQTATRDAIARGTMTLTLDGARAGALTQLGLGELSPDGSDQVSFTLRYFRTVEIPIVVPGDFTPAAVQIEFRSNRTGPEPQRESFPWRPAPEEAGQPEGGETGQPALTDEATAE